MSVNLTWWPDLNWPGLKNSHIVQNWCATSYAKRRGVTRGGFLVIRKKNARGWWHTPTHTGAKVSEGQDSKTYWRKLMLHFLLGQGNPCTEICTNSSQHSDRCNKSRRKCRNKHAEINYILCIACHNKVDNLVCMGNLNKTILGQNVHKRGISSSIWLINRL